MEAFAWSCAGIGITILFASLFAGCCNCTTQRTSLGPLPPPISPEEQVRLINDRVRALPRLRAVTVDRGVELHYTDDNGNRHTDNFEGILQLRQPAAGGPAEVRIVGTAFSQTVLDTGRNQTDWWVTIGKDAKSTHVGDSRKAIDWSSLQSTGANILRPDLVQDLLGLTILNSVSRTVITFNRNPLPPDAILMRVDDETGINDLLFGRQPTSPRTISQNELDSEMIVGGQLLAREILVDRRSGDIREVRLYDPRGVVVVRSVLDDYRATAYTGKATDAPPPLPSRFPFHVQIDFPSQQLRISLKFDTVTIPAKINDAAFETPDFEGMHVIREP